MKMYECHEKHEHRYWFTTRVFDDAPMETRFLRTWTTARKFVFNLGCDCCTRAPTIESLEQGKLYEMGYQGSFRFMGCVAEGMKNWMDDELSSDGTSEAKDS